MEQSASPIAEAIEASDFLTPEQRREAVAQILATVALRILKAEDEQAKNQ
jgi:hypothetical protein